MTIDQAKKLQGREGSFGVAWATRTLPLPKMAGATATIPHEIVGSCIGIDDAGLVHIRDGERNVLMIPATEIVYFTQPTKLAAA